ncbi:cache domain-containing sensor histidine kinase [Paenibacillus baekrokdamisoli]|uniref:cache domain-containing sensor histidine kinase n=1 Tax=Paenibacillus baekrokdamisoli TaxID=1712516 RepID=UPI001E4912EA|nr:sensor histidine kinase [Paenibacillus baekrokdamisoli]
MISYIIICLMPIIAVGIFSYTTFMHAMKEHTRISMSETLQQMSDNIAFKLEDIRRVSDLLYNDDTLAGNIQNYDEGWDSYESNIKYMIPKFQSTINATSQNIQLTVYMNNPAVPEVYSTSLHMEDPLVLHKRSFEMYNIRRIEKEEWYRQFPEEQYGTTMLWQQVGDDSQYGNISLLRRLVDSSDPFTRNQIGFIRITTKISSLFQSLDYPKLGEGTLVFAVDAQERIMYASKDAFIHHYWREYTSNDKLVISQPLPDFNMNLAALIPVEILEKDARQLANLTIIVCLISLAVCIIASGVISRMFSRRVSKVISVLHFFQEGEYDKRIRYKGGDEFTYIVSALNQLGEHMNQLIKETYLSKIEKQELELESLQAQINPHFLYNTLSSINRLAQFGELKKLQMMVMGLSKFYRNSLNNGKTLISVEKELEQVTSYIEIQQIKYTDRLVVELHIDPSVLTYNTVKLILQPFVENTIEHGWNGEGKIHIAIYAEMDNGRIIFQIVDGGSGMSVETIAQIFTPNDGAYLGYGIRNVDQRIKLHFGSEYGVSIMSRIGIGTTIKIIIPAANQQKLIAT